MLLDLSFLILLNLFPAVPVIAVHSAFVLAICKAMILNHGCILEQPGVFIKEKDMYSNSTPDWLNHSFWGLGLGTSIF